MMTEKFGTVMEALSRVVPETPPAGSTTGAGGGGESRGEGTPLPALVVVWNKRRSPDRGSRENEDCRTQPRKDPRCRLRRTSRAKAQPVTRRHGTTQP
ncbi:unnamed protein product [Ectocarpus sp. CCAP 1310/34]|nr:unnamed protein product [Ectocarpus sp. CCAP 1310/34]